MRENSIFRHTGLKAFYYSPDAVVFSDDSLRTLDSEVVSYERHSAPDIRQALVNRNEIMASYAISQVEQTSRITPDEAESIRQAYEQDRTLEFRPSSKADIKRIEKDFDRQEFLNILKTFRWVSAQELSIKDLTVDFIREVHFRLTAGLDAYTAALFDVLPYDAAAAKARTGKFTQYNPGNLRANDNVMVGASYRPVKATEVQSALVDAIRAFRSEWSLTGLNLFTAALYTIHPFTNGNKRLCRLLEHGFLRALGFNQSNIYSNAYYYYQELERFYERLGRTLDTGNFLPMVNFMREALFYSMLNVYESGAEYKRERMIEAYLDRYRYRRKADRGKVLRLFVKRQKISFAELKDSIYGQFSVRTLQNYLKEFVKEGLLRKEVQGRESLYVCTLATGEAKMIRGHVLEAVENIEFVPDLFKQYLFVV